MKISSVVFAIVCLPGVAAAASNAVSAPNAELGAMFGKYEYENTGADGDTENVFGQFNVPLGQRFGLDLRVQDGEAKSNAASISPSYEFLQYMVSPFWRNPDVGLFGMSYGRSNFGFSNTSAETRTQDGGINGSLYLASATLSAWYETNKFSNGARNKNLWTNLAWYPNPDFLLNLGVGAKDSKKNYYAGFEHQFAAVPGLALGMTYSWSRTAAESQAWSATLAYRFGPNKSLMHRYREDLFSTK